MSDALKRIEAYKRAEITARKRAISLTDLERQAETAGAVRGFLTALRAEAATGTPALIAEVKKASPSKGLIRADFDPPALARAYADGGATCLSVLTDAPSFQGHEDFLVAARTTVDLPVLRKDFLYDPWQVTESRALGADCILVILAAVDDSTALELIETASRWGMDALIEVHDEEEMRRALDLPGELLGVNNRNLRTFDTALETFERLAPMAGETHFLVAESGLFTPHDVHRVAQAGAQGLLVGESLMRQSDVTAATSTLLGRT